MGWQQIDIFTTLEDGSMVIVPSNDLENLLGPGPTRSEN